MAKKNVRDEPPKTQVTENAQLSDIVFILDKMELLLQAISDIDKNGRYKTVSADKKHRNSFLKIDRYASMFENFLKNFWSQLKDPTRFGILSVKENALDNPEVRQAIEDLAAGRKSDAVEEFLKKYEIVPRSKENQSINHQNQEEMAKKTETQQQAAPETAQQPKYRYNESMINWEELKKYGLSREYLQERGLLDQMLRGYKTNQVVPISMNFGSAVLRTDARLSLQQSVGGPIVLGIHGIRQKPELDRPYFGHIFSEEDKKNLLETGNMGRVVELLAYRSIFRKELLCSLSAGTVLYFPSFPIFDTACKISSILSSMNTMSLICSFSLTCGFRGSSLTFFFAITLSF